MASQPKVKKKEIMRIERESVIMTMKPKLIMGLAELMELESDKQEFLTLCKRIDATVRAWYHVQFEELMQLYSLFDPVYGAKKLEKQRFTVKEVDKFERQFLDLLFKIMEKSNYKLLSKEEFEIARSGQYLLNLPIAVDKAKLDKKLFQQYFTEHPIEGLPEFMNQYVIFRQGVGVDRTSGYFFTEKIDSLISRIWDKLLTKSRLRKLAFRGQVDQSASISRIMDSVPNNDLDGAGEDLYVERIRIQNMQISIRNLLSKTTVQEPTFERMILVYRRATLPKNVSQYGDRAIHIKQFRNIPMADMELVLPEKKNPGLTPMDWTKLLVSAGVGLVTLVTSMEMPKADFWVVLAILGGIVGYCVKIFLTFQQSLVEYQNLITRSMYDKQLDSGRGTLLHMCDDVIQQEVKEIIVAYFILISQGRATLEDLDSRCEQLMEEEYEEKCNFEVDDAVKKMERLGIVTKDSLGRYCHVSLKRANEIIGLTTEERVAKPAL